MIRLNIKIKYQHMKLQWDKYIFVMLKKYNRKVVNKNFRAEMFLNKNKINVQFINYQIQK